MKTLNNSPNRFIYHGDKTHIFPIKNIYLLQFILFSLYMFFPPSLLFHVYNFEYTIQYPIAFTLLFLLIYHSRSIFIKESILLVGIQVLLILLIIINSGAIYPKFLYGITIVAFGTTMFLLNPSIGKTLLAAHITIACILSFIVLIQYILINTGITIEYYIPTDYIVRNAGIKMNPLFGIEIVSYGRYTSFFTEPNRFGYFLAIPFIYMFLNPKRKVYELFIVVILGIAILLTKSMFTIFSILIALFVYFSGIKYRTLLILFSFFFVAYIYYDSVLVLLGRVNSFSERVWATVDTITLVKRNPFGYAIGHNFLNEPGIIIGTTFTAINFWAVYGGIFGLLLFLLLLQRIIKIMVSLFRSKIQYNKLIATAYFAYFLQQIWLQDGFGYLFLLYLSLLISLYYRLKMFESPKRTIEPIIGY